MYGSEFPRSGERIILLLFAPLLRECVLLCHFFVESDTFSRDGDNTPSQVSFCLVRPPRVHFVSGPYNKTLLTPRASHQAGKQKT